MELAFRDLTWRRFQFICALDMAIKPVLMAYPEFAVQLFGYVLTTGWYLMTTVDMVLYFMMDAPLSFVGNWIAYGVATTLAGAGLSQTYANTMGHTAAIGVWITLGLILMYLCVRPLGNNHVKLS